MFSSDLTLVLKVWFMFLFPHHNTQKNAVHLYLPVSHHRSIWFMFSSHTLVGYLTGRGYPDGRVYAMGRTPQEALSTITHGSENDFEVGQMDELDLDVVLDEFDIDIVDDIFPQKGMVQNDFYDDDMDGKFEVLPYKNEDESESTSWRYDLKKQQLNNLLKNIG